MDNLDHPVEFADSLYSQLDSSGGDFKTLLRDLDDCGPADTIVEVKNSLRIADKKLSQAFELLDAVILEAASETNGEFQFEQNVGDEISKVSTLLSQAESEVVDALKKSDLIEDSDISSSFRFGTYTEISPSVNYILGEVEKMNELSDELEARY